MDTFDAIKERRSVKHYDPTHKLSEDEIEKLMSLAVLSPTSFNIQNWRFVLVKEPEIRKKIRAASWDQAQVTDSSLLLVICADLKSWKKDPAQYWKDAPKEARDFLVPAMGCFTKEKNNYKEMRQ